MTGIGGTQAWVDYLGQVELPVLAQTLNQINSITESHTSSVHDLAEVILRDADLTSQVLKISNTVYYNPSSQVISTVSRAIALVGFETVKGIAMTSALIDALLSKQPRPHLLKNLAFALHGAVQARQLLGAQDGRRREEIFIAALLSSIGELVFWSCNTTQAAQLEEALQQQSPSSAQRAVLGTTFPEVTRQLMESWHLGTLIRAVAGTRPEGALVEQIRLICRLVREAETGWDTPRAADTREQLARSLGTPLATLQGQLRQNLQQTVDIARTYRIEMILPYLPLQTRRAGHRPPAPTGDPALQLQILRDMALILAERPSLNAILQILAEGIHRGVGLERVAILILSARENRFLPRIVLGHRTEHWKVQFTLPPEGRTVLHEALKEPHLALLGSAEGGLAKSLEPLAFDPWIGRHPGVLAPLTIGSRCVGLLYADRGEQGWPITPEQHHAFAHFAQQARLSLLYLSDGRLQF